MSLEASKVRTQREFSVRKRLCRTLKEGCPGVSISRARKLGERLPSVHSLNSCLIFSVRRSGKGDKEGGGGERGEEVFVEFDASWPV